MLAPMLVAERKSCLAKGEKLPTLFSILSYLFSGEVALGETGEKRENRKEKREKNKKGKLLRDFPLFGLPERIRTFDLQSRSLTRYPAVPRVDMKLYSTIIAYLREKCNPFLKKSPAVRLLFTRRFPTENTLRRGAGPLWKTPPFPVDFSTSLPKSFPQLVGKSVDISATFWKNPRKIREFRGFSRLKSNFGGVDNYQTVIFCLGVFHRGRE